MNRFVIIFEGRNGSSPLVSMLNAHRSVLCYPEILAGISAAAQRQAISVALTGQDVRPITAFAADPAYYPQGFEAKFATAPFAAVGFKTKVTDLLNMPAVLMILEQHDVRLIHLCRRNILKSVLSFLNVRRMREHHGLSNVERPDQVIGGQIHIDLVQFNAILRRRQLAESLHGWFFNHYPGARVRLAYEDLLADRPGFATDVLSFLEVPEQDLGQGKFHKMTPAKLSDAIENYDEFAQHFKSTEFARFLD